MRNTIGIFAAILSGLLASTIWNMTNIPWQTRALGCFITLFVAVGVYVTFQEPELREPHL